MDINDAIGRIFVNVKTKQIFVPARWFNASGRVMFVGTLSSCCTSKVQAMTAEDLERGWKLK